MAVKAEVDVVILDGDNTERSPVKVGFVANKSSTSAGGTDQYVGIGGMYKASSGLDLSSGASISAQKVEIPKVTDEIWKEFLNDKSDGNEDLAADEIDLGEGEGEDGLDMIVEAFKIIGEIKKNDEQNETSNPGASESPEEPVVSVCNEEPVISVRSEEPVHVDTFFLDKSKKIAKEFVKQSDDGSEPYVSVYPDPGVEESGPDESIGQPHSDGCEGSRGVVTY